MSLEKALERVNSLEKRILSVKALMKTLIKSFEKLSESNNKKDEMIGTSGLLILRGLFELLNKELTIIKTYIHKSIKLDETPKEETNNVKRRGRPPKEKINSEAKKLPKVIQTNI